MGLTRRTVLAAGAAAAATAAVPDVFAQQSGKGANGKFYERGLFASTTKRPGRASRYYCFPAAD